MVEYSNPNYTPKVGDSMELDLGQIGPSNMLILRVGKKTVELLHRSTWKKINLSREAFDDFVETERKYGTEA
jgi:hypothetical protein